MTSTAASRWRSRGSSWRRRCCSSRIVRSRTRHGRATRGSMLIRSRAGSASSCGTRRPTMSCCAPPRRASSTAPGGLAKAVDRMLASPRLETGVRAFFDDMLRFDDLRRALQGSRHLSDLQRRDRRRTRASRRCARWSTSCSSGSAITATCSRRRDTFISPSLARHLRRGRRRRAGPPSRAPPDSPRAGLLTQVSFLAAHCASGPQLAHPARQGAARAAAVPDGAAAAAQRGLLAARGRRTRA